MLQMMNLQLGMAANRALLAGEGAAQDLGYQEVMEQFIGHMRSAIGATCTSFPRPIVIANPWPSAPSVASACRITKPE